jgi:uncharacterized protein
MPPGYPEDSSVKRSWFFATDLHGRRGRYRALLAAVAAARPEAVLLGGDLLPHPFAPAAADRGGDDFLADFLAPALADLRRTLGARYPRWLVIPGNDDPRALEPRFRELADAGLWEFLPGAWSEVGGVPVLGYPFVPPTPFRLKDWERYDVSRFTDPGCVAPEEGVHSVPVDRERLPYLTIAADLDRLAAGRELAAAVLLCHGPPYRTVLDRAALDGRRIDHVPLDVHVGSIALRRFIEREQPAASLHGHIHETVRLTGEWRERIGRTWCLSACHDGPELGLVILDPRQPADAERLLLPASE